MLFNRWRLAVVLAGHVGCSQAQTWRNQVNISMCTWGEVRANTIRDTVYLDGGNLWWQLGYDNGEVSPDNRDNSEGLLYYFNLSSTFNTAITNLTSLFGSIPKAGGIANNLAPTYHDGVIFANDNKFYLYGGLLRPTDSQDALPGDTVLAYERYQYGPHVNLWESGFINTNLDDNVTRYITHGAGVSSPSENLGFYVSGMRAPDWGPIYDNSSATSLSRRMIKVDMSEMRDPEWTNLTLPQYVPARANAEAVWVPVSESGVVVLIGGVINPESLFADGLNSNQGNASERTSPTFMETVPLYDVAGDRWYIQNTTGDIPPQLTKFCSVYASASDGSSHNIYIYGGYDGLSPLNEPSDDVYVLSLPSFEWIKLYEGDRALGRKAHKCVKPYPDRMLVLGGMAIDSISCIDMVRVFNLNTGRFQDTYNPGDWGEYEVPSLVSGRIGGDSSGGATKTSPDSWTNSSLEDVFLARYTKSIATWYPYNSTTNGTQLEPVSSGGSGFPGWAGAVIGVVVGLVVVGGVIAFWFIRRRKNQDSRRQSDVSIGSRVMQWVHSGAFAPPGPKDPENSTVVSGGYTNNSTIAPSVAGIGVSRPTAEAGSEPVYEMHGQSVAHAVELPTSYNEGTFPTSVPLSAVSTPQTAYPSPVSPEIPQEKGAEGPASRPTHHRNVSSLSSIQSYTGTRTVEADDGAVTQPRYVSGVSEASVSTDGTRAGDFGMNPRELDDIPDTEGDDINRDS